MRRTAKPRRRRPAARGGPDRMAARRGKGRPAARRKSRKPAAKPVDLIGRPLRRYHREVLDLYRRTKSLCARKDLPPFAARNLRASLAALYQVVNDAGIEFEHLYDLGV